MDFDYPLQQSKNQKTESKGFRVEDDRISRLSDDVLSHILSFVTPTEYSIRTSVLSRRWEHLWALLSPKFILEFRPWTFSNRNKVPYYRRFINHCATTFTHSVDNLLFIRDSLHIDTFKLCFNAEGLPSPARAGSWICAIVMCNVRELDLEMKYTMNDLGELPWCLFTCKTLTVLKLSGEFILNVPYSVCLPNLKTLLLEAFIYLGDESIQKLLSGCPVLEELHMIRHNWDQMWTISVCHSSLKRLRLRFARQQGDDRYKVVVDARNIEFIDIVDGWSDDIVLNCLPNIVEAHVDINKFAYRRREENLYTNRVFVLLQSIVNVRRLFLIGNTLRIFPYDLRLVMPTFCNLVELDISYTPDEGPLLLMDLLRSSPKLELLSLPWGVHYYDKYEIDHEFCENNPEQVPECLRHSLKIVQVQNFKGFKVELNIVEYLLKYGMVLENMTVFCRYQPTSAKFDKIRSVLTNYTRLSTDCQLNFLH